MNRIEQAINRVESKLEALTIDENKMAELEGAASLDFDMYCDLQNRKSAFIGTVLTLEEGNTLYGILGNEPSQFKKQSLAKRIVAVKIYGELLGV